MNSRIAFHCVCLGILVVGTSSMGCTTKVPPPTPPPFAGEVINIDIGEVLLADAMSASRAIEEPIKLPRKAMLRIHGMYQSVDAAKDKPVNIDITRQSRSGAPTTYSSGASGPVKQDSGKYAFTTDILTPVSGSGEFELTLRAGKRFIAHGKVIVGN